MEQAIHLLSPLEELLHKARKQSAPRVIMSLLLVLSAYDEEIILEKGEILSEKRHWCPFDPRAE